MATILENEAAWSTTAATNANVDTGVNWAENQDAASVNNSARGMMAARRKAALDQGGSLVAGGAADALTVTTNQVLSAAHLVAGLFLSLRAIADNATTTPTFAPDGLTAAPIKRADGSALAAGSIKSGMMLQLYYNAGSSEWRAGNIAPVIAGAVVIQKFTAAGAVSYTPSVGLLYAIVECVGGGGGGGGTVNSNSGARQSGGGGGGGGYSRSVVTAAQVGAGLSGTVGAAGSAGGNGNNGFTGGDTTLTISPTSCIGKGGSGGGGATLGAQGAGGAGGVQGTGDLSIAGQPGMGGIAMTTISVVMHSSGGGAAAAGFGAGAANVAWGSGAGTSGSLYGGGGSGGGSSNNGGGFAGGAGATGIIVITEFCNN